MRFYRIDALFNTKDEIPSAKSKEFGGFAVSMKSNSERFYEQTDEKAIIFGSKTDNRKAMTFGAIVKGNDDINELFERFTSTFFFKPVSFNAEEVVLKSFRADMRYADRYDFIEDDQGLLDMFGVGTLNSRFHTRYFEDMVSQTNRQTITEKAENNLYSETFLPEIDRIYSGKKQKAAQGHPVHYLIRTRESDTRNELCESLIFALNENKRIINKRYVSIYLNDRSTFIPSEIRMLYEYNEGGAVVIDYHTAEEDDDEFARNQTDLIEFICENAKRYRNKVQSIICIDKDSNKISDLFLSYLTEIPIVEIFEDAADYDRAVKYLKHKAKENSVRFDKKLDARLKTNGSYNITELNGIFNKWYAKKLHTEIYPQYKYVNTAKSEVVKAKPKGSAIKELDEMIGLENAKKVINEAICFYKMQKLYAEKGICASRPAMHMIFTGNPGTAKTTVARLFARIMRDNGLLSKGGLFEVGRSDIVGKYVGWTAPTVKNLFKKAKGSVLFIDEAYSLVDDRSGCFGDEAINTIVQEMENNRDDLVVIFAGYPDKMEEFLNKNPGLRSRIAFHVNFDDYNTPELIDIANLMIKKTGFEFSDDARTRLSDIFETARTIPDFGNGRYVRNLIELSTLQQASRLAQGEIDELTDEDVRTITRDDICIPMIKHLDSSSKTERKRIGF